MTGLARHQLWRYVPVALVLVAFLAAYFVNTSRLRELGNAALRSVADAQWSAYQAEFELQRLLTAVDRYTLGDDAITRGAVIERVDILWSRLPPLVQGSESRLLHEKTHAADVVRDLTASLETVERLLATRSPGPALQRAIRSQLEPHVRLLHDVVLGTVHATSARQADLQRRVRLLSENHVIAMLGMIGATLVLGGLLLLEIRRARRLLADAARARERVDHLAHHDSLTGLPNRRLFDDRLRVALARTRRTGEGLALHLIDVDRFKEVNDRLGHAGGDRLLVHLADRLRSCIRETDTLARLGGDELAVLQAGVIIAEDARTLARRLTEAARDSLDLDGERVGPTVSVGVALAPAHGNDRATLMRHADRALYAAKSAGRDSFVIFADASVQRVISMVHSGPEDTPNVLAKSP